jgi:hypothetical protein
VKSCVKMISLVITVLTIGAIVFFIMQIRNPDPQNIYQITVFITDTLYVYVLCGLVCAQNQIATKWLIANINTFFVGIIVYLCIQLITCVLTLYGIQKCRPQFLIPDLFLTFLLYFVYFLYACFSTYMMSMAQQNGFTIAFDIIYHLAMLLMLLWFIVYNKFKCYKYLKEMIAHHS